MTKYGTDTTIVIFHVTFTCIINKIVKKLPDFIFSVKIVMTLILQRSFGKICIIMPVNMPEKRLGAPYSRPQNLGWL